jgi:hypothetical protein
VKRSKTSKRRSPSRSKSRSTTAKRRGPRIRADSHTGAATESETGSQSTIFGSTIGQPLSKLFNLQRNLLRAGAGAALSAVDNPASKFVTGGVTDSLQGGLKKLEEVFDQRVADALTRLGMPSPELLRELIARVDALTEIVQADAKLRQRK